MPTDPLASTTPQTAKQSSTSEHDATSLVDIIRSANPSQRLLEFVQSADQANALPSLSLHDFFANRTRRVIEFIELPGMEDDIFSELMVLLFDAYSTHPEAMSSGSSTARAFKDPIEDIVAKTPCSIRLKNAISAAAQSNLIPHSSLHDFAQAGRTAIDAYRSIPSVGAALLLELEALLNAEIQRRASAEDELANLLTPVSWASSDYQQETLQAQWTARIEELERLDPQGEQYVKPAAFQLGRYWPDSLSKLQIRAFYGKSFDQAWEQISTDLAPTEIRTSFQTLLAVLDEYIFQRQEITVTLDPKHILRSLLSRLTLRESDVIDQRYGITDGSPKTLQHIAHQFGITRERVRQIENHALEQLMQPLTRVDFRLYLYACKETTEEQLLGPHQCAALNEMQIRQASLDGMTRLAIDCCHGGELINYANAHFKTFSGIYYSLDIAAQQLASEIDMIDAAIGATKLPKTLEDLATTIGATTDALKIYTVLNSKFGIHRSCLYRGKLSPRIKRAINLLHIAISRFGGASISLEQLYTNYLRAHPEDQCLDRNIRIVLSEFRHLFVNLTDAGYWVMNKHSSLKRQPAVSSLKPEELFASMGKSELQMSLMSLVQEMGPSPLLDIRNEFERRHPNWSKNSVFALLSDRPYYIRMAPGVMGSALTREQPADVDKLDFLFTKRQVSYYVYSKLSDARFTYPLWTPRLEYAWCKWGEQNLPGDIFASLLSVADPSSWPCSGAEQLRWAEMIEAKGASFHLPVPKIPHHKNPTVRDIASLAYYAADLPTVSWIDFNRVLGSRIDDRIGLNRIMIMIRLGILYPSKRWYLPVRTNSAALFRFINEFVCHGLSDNDWHHYAPLLENQTATVDWADQERLDAIVQNLMPA